jgi:hypothetical protein
MSENADKPQLVESPKPKEPEVIVAPKKPEAPLFSIKRDPEPTKPVAEKRGPGRPPKKASPVSTDAEGMLTITERETFVTALMDLSDMADEGLWHLGVDTDPDVPDRDGNAGVPIWHMDKDEAEKVMHSFLALGKHRPEVFKAMRALNNAHDHLQAGIIVGSRFLETGLRFFESGINFRLSKAAAMRQVQNWNNSQDRPLKLSSR